MLRRATKIQLLAFLVIALLGVSYVGARYAGVTTLLFGRGGCTITADFPDSDGIFTNAEVTYRGVGIGKVTDISLTATGIRVSLNLNSCDHPQIPASTSATVADRSAVGEQYVNLVASKDQGPYLSAGGNLPSSQNKLPIPTATFVTNLNNLAASINTTALHNALDELNKAFDDKGPDLGTLADSIISLIDTASQNLPQTLQLIQNSTTVLNTQINAGSDIATWAKSLDQLTATLKSSDGNIQSLLNNGPSAFSAVSTFVTNNQDSLGVVLANLTTLNQVVTARINGVQQVLSLLPIAISDGLTVIPGDGTLHLGYASTAANAYDANGNSIPILPLCTAGYGGTAKRNSLNTASSAANTSAQCTDSSNDVRGAANTPGGDPVSTAGGGTVYPRATTNNVLRVGYTANPVAASALGDKSWLTILTTGLN